MPQLMTHLLVVVPVITLLILIFVSLSYEECVRLFLFFRQAVRLITATPIDIIPAMNRNAVFAFA